MGLNEPTKKYLEAQLLELANCEDLAEKTYKSPGFREGCWRRAEGIRQWVKETIPKCLDEAEQEEAWAIVEDWGFGDIRSE